MSTPQAFLMASPPARFTGFGVARADLARACAVVRPISTRLEPVLALRGFDHWFLHSYTFPSRLPDPGRLAVPTRPVVVRAAPTLPCDSRGRLPSASSGRCDGPKEGSFHPLTVKQRLVTHDRPPINPRRLHRYGVNSGVHQKRRQLGQAGLGGREPLLGDLRSEERPVG